MNFYKTTKWKRKRELILKRDGYLCQYWKRYGKTIPAETVHHILPREDYPEYALTNWNLIALSNDAHNKMHNRTSGELTEEGRRLVERTLKKNKIVLPE